MEQLADSAAVVADDGAAEGEGFEDGETEGLWLLGERHDDVAHGHELAQVAAVAEKDYVVGDAEVVGLPLEPLQVSLFFLVGVTGDQAADGLAGLFQLFDELEKVAMSLQSRDPARE